MTEDLTGRTFGRLTVIRPARPSEGRKGRTCLVCLCSCGRETVVELSHLKSGHTKSCGCWRQDFARERLKKAEKGERFGRLTVLEAVTLPNGSEPYWKCRCDCGREVLCKKEYLLSGSTKSCGCLGDETRRKNMQKAIHFVKGTCIEKIAARREGSRNTSGHRGVYRRENNRWRASIGFQGKNYNLGTFEHYEDAVKARLDAEARLYDTFLNEYREASSSEAEENDKH